MIAKVRYWKNGTLKNVFSRLKRYPRKCCSIWVDTKTKKISTYADVLKAKQNAYQTLIIRPKNAKQTSVKTKTEVTEVIDPEKLSIGISVVKKIDKGSVVVGCTSREALKKLKTEAESKLGQAYEIKEAPTHKPKVIVTGLF